MISFSRIKIREITEVRPPATEEGVRDISPAIAGQLQHILDLDQFQNQVKKKLSRTRLRLKMSSITKI